MQVHELEYFQAERIANFITSNIIIDNDLHGLLLWFAMGSGVKYSSRSLHRIPMIKQALNDNKFGHVPFPASNS